jgi:uncharacterized protein (UPF0276 family)
MSETPPSQTDIVGPIPANAGIGLRGPHHSHFLKHAGQIPWLEVHSENFFAEHGVAIQLLERIRDDYPISLHGVGLSLGSADPLDTAHLDKLIRLVERIEPGLVSEHLCWGSSAGRHSNDLLPLPYTTQALDHMCERVDLVQSRLKRTMLIENVSSYLEFECSDIPEWVFVRSLAERTGAKVLLDINNIYVNACNHGFDAHTYISSIPSALVSEIHLAGHSAQNYDGYEILVDTHNSPVCAEVWNLYEFAIRTLGAKPTLIEWDSELPTVEFLLGEAQQAQSIIERVNERAA